MDNKDRRGLSFYIAFGMAAGALVGIITAVFAALVLHSLFLAVSGTGFGMCAGVLVADIVYCMKYKVK